MSFIYGVDEKNSKVEVIFAVCRLPFTSCLTSLLTAHINREAAVQTRKSPKPVGTERRIERIMVTLYVARQLITRQ